MPNSANSVPNPAQMPESTQEYVKYLLKTRGYSVQKLCDETGLSKSTMDKFLAGQTYDTSFTNVKKAVKHLGGSLDYLAQIAAEEDAPAPAKPQDKPRTQDLSALPFLVESYEKEIDRINANHEKEVQRVSAVHEKYLAHVVELVETGRQALISQHTAAISHAKEICDTAISETRQHLDSFRRGRNVWRGVSLALVVIMFVVAGWLVWEFSNLSTGLTGYLLRQAGLISMAGGPT